METSASFPTLEPGTALGRYELLLPIAQGGMAQVWAARLHGSRGFKKLVAIKTLLATANSDPRMEHMFLAEAELASQIHHPNVVGTLDLGEHEGVLYLVMEWVEGEPLSAIIAKAASSGGVPLEIGVNLIGQACQGLGAAHDLRDDNGARLGLVHRDVSPQNVLVTYSGTVKVVDFGIAKATTRSSALTDVGEIKGKFSYMAPEQVRGAALDCRADLFSLGIVLYAVTTGRHPFRAEHPAQTVQNICSDRAPVPPTSFVPHYPPALEQVVLKALAKDPNRRYATASAMLAALEQALPRAFDASSDEEVAEFMTELFGGRASERRQALRTAQENGDRIRADSSSKISLGTLKAIAIDESQTKTELAPAPVAKPPALPAVSPPIVAPRRRRDDRWLHACVGALSVALAVSAALRISAVVYGRGPLAVAPPGPALVLEAPPPRAAAAAAAAAAPVTPPVAPAVAPPPPPVPSTSASSSSSPLERAAAPCTEHPGQEPCSKR